MDENEGINSELNKDFGKPIENKTPGLCLITGHELAAKLSVTKKAVERWTSKRLIPGQIKVGRLWRYSLVEIEKRIQSGNGFLMIESKPSFGTGRIKFSLPTRRER